MSEVRHRADRGFTLIELMISIVLSGVIGGVIVAALFTSLNVADSTTGQIKDSTDAGLLSSFLFRDAQSAGATDPSTAGADSTVGVSTTDWGGCTQAGPSPAPVVRFSWIDHTTSVTQRRVVVTYALAGAELTRRSCTWLASDTNLVTMTSSSVASLGRNIGTAVVTCAPAADCAGQPASVALTVTGAGARAPFAYTLRAAMRTRTQVAPTIDNSSPIPVLVLDGDLTTACPNATLSGTGTVSVLGSVLIDSTCGTTPVSGPLTKFVPTGVAATTPGNEDPYARRVPPAFTCPASGGTNPAIGGANAGGEYGVVVYPLRVTITTNVTFQPGRHVFCHGLAINGGSVTGTGVLLYVPDATDTPSLTIATAATVDLAPSAIGSDLNLLIWVASAQPITIASGTRVNNLRGVIYAPRSQLTLSSAVATYDSDIGGLVIKKLVITNVGKARLGLPIPTMVIANNPPPNSGQVGVFYAGPAQSVTGGTGTIVWKVTAPTGLTINSTTGVVSGTPTASTPTPVIVTAVDATGAAESVDYPITITAAPTITGSATLPAGQVAVTYSTTMSSSGGTAPKTWAASGLPPGLSIAPTTGVISGKPTASGTYPVTFTLTDARSASATTTRTIDVAAQLTISGPASLPNGQIGSVYATTTMTSDGGTAPKVWTATGLPAGLTIDSATGTLSGQPTAAGSFAATITVKDAKFASAALPRTIVITAAPTISGPASLPNGQVAVPYTTTSVTTLGGTAPFTWAATGLPPGMSVDPANGAVSGTPTVQGSFVAAVTATDSLGAAATASLPLSIAGAAAPPPVTCPTTINGWRGEYFSNITLAAPTSLCRDDANIAFSWAAGSPAAAVPVDNFSARWTRTLNFGAGDYVFAVGSDDGARLFIDGVLVLDRFVYQSYPNPIPTVTATLTGGSHTIVMEYFEGNGSAQATLTWAPQAVVPAGCPASPAGWSGEYYANISLSGTPALCRDDAAINFDWGGGSPGTAIPSDNFSARWRRTQDFTAGRYTFALGSDDGGRLYVDGVLVIDRWVDQAYPNPVPTAIVDLTAGAHTIMVEYYERGGSAAAILTWAPTPA